MIVTRSLELYLIRPMNLTLCAQEASWRQFELKNRREVQITCESIYFYYRTQAAADRRLGLIKEIEWLVAAVWESPFAASVSKLEVIS